jgi:hypothetical protein
MMVTDITRKPIEKQTLRDGIGSIGSVGVGNRGQVD